jgi:hypothetical protein
MNEQSPGHEALETFESWMRSTEPQRAVSAYHIMFPGFYDFPCVKLGGLASSLLIQNSDGSTTPCLILEVHHDQLTRTVKF